MPRMRLPLVGHLARGLVLTRPTSLPLLPFSVWHFLRIVSFVKRCCSVQVVLRMRRCVWSFAFARPEEEVSSGSSCSATFPLAPSILLIEE